MVRPSRIRAGQKSKAVKVYLYIALLFIVLGLPDPACADYKKQCSPSIQDCYDPTLYNAIQSSSDPFALLHLAAQESTFGKTQCKVSYDKDGSQGWGPMQINDGGHHDGSGGTISECKSVASGKTLVQLWTPVSGGASKCKNNWDTVVDKAVQCADIIYRAKSKKCSVFASKLCSYNRGQGWCISGKKGTKTGCNKHYGENADCGPDKGCSYSKSACIALGTKDCEGSSPTAGTVPPPLVDGATDVPNVAPYTQEQKAAVGNDSAKLPPNCHDINLMQSMTMAKKGFQTGDMLIAGDVYNKHNTSTKYMECIITISGYFNVIQNILQILTGLKDTIAGLIMAVVVKILDFACEYVVAGINYLLASACLPMSSLDLNLDLPGMPSTTCDGLSLLDLMQAHGTFSTNIPTSPYSGGASLGLDQLIKKK
jgi:hypothetical protein